MVIDPEECKRKIPWPLVNDRSQSREFRTSFANFIKTINKKYKDASIPEMNASSFQTPGGEKFLHFLYKLSTFALELDLRKMSSREEQTNMLPRPVPSRGAAQQVQLTMVRGAVCKEAKALQEVTEYVANAAEVIKKMNDLLNVTSTTCKSVTEDLKMKVSSLDCDEETKSRLLDIEDSSAIAAYNEKVEKLYEEIKSNCHKLKQLHSLANQCSQLVKIATAPPEESQCLDGRKLKSIISSNKVLYSLAGRSLVNEQGGVRLLEIVRATQTAINRLTTRSSGSSALLLPAQDLQVQCNAMETTVRNIESSLKQLFQENEKVVKTLRTKVYSALRKKKIPEIFKCLKERPPLVFDIPQSIQKKDSFLKPGYKRKSFGTVVKKRKNTVLCTLKTKREYKRQVTSTPFFKTPASRKSLNNTMLLLGTAQDKEAFPTPSRLSPRKKSVTCEKKIVKKVHKDLPPPFQLSPKKKLVSSEKKSVKKIHQRSTPAVESKRLATTLEEPTLSSTGDSVSQTSEVSEPSVSSAVRCGRKSLNDIFERYRKLKESMNTTSSSRNDSDTLNDNNV